MTRVLIFGDSGVPTGFGRICDEVGIRLHKRGHTIMAASLPYDGLLPPQYEGAVLPYPVASLGGKPSWIEPLMSVITAWQPEVVIACQDFPFGEQLFLAPLDWSRMGRVIITPVDGKPLYPNWLAAAKRADAVLTISEFGVQAFKEAGIEVGMCRPGVNNDKFYRLRDDERAAIRTRLGIEPGAFVVGTMAMNQGRKAIPQMLHAFFQFAQDKPTARYLLDMEATSAAGWDIKALCQQFGWDAGKLIFRTDALQRGVMELRERYNALDVHVVLAYREGYGLPLSEAMACGVVSAALDWSSGTEVVGEGRGLLIKAIDYFMPSTWGGALDKLPDYNHLSEQLQWLYEHPAEKIAMAERGMQWARRQTWDAGADAVMSAIDRAQARVKPFTLITQPAIIVPTIQAQPDGIKPVELVEAAGG